jgi:hypothetical protein
LFFSLKMSEDEEEVDRLLAACQPLIRFRFESAEQEAQLTDRLRQVVRGLAAAEGRHGDLLTALLQQPDGGSQAEEKWWIPYLDV